MSANPNQSVPWNIASDVETGNNSNSGFVSGAEVGDIDSVGIITKVFLQLIS